MKIGDKIFCPSCADVSGEIGSGIKFCHKCGIRMVVLKCNKCGQGVVNKDYRRCGYCGGDPKEVVKEDAKSSSIKVYAKSSLERFEKNPLDIEED